MNLHPLKFERDRRGWSLSQVAKMLGTTALVVKLWEQNLLMPSPYYQEQLCRLYETNAQQLGLASDERAQLYQKLKRAWDPCFHSTEWLLPMIALLCILLTLGYSLLGYRGISNRFIGPHLPANGGSTLIPLTRYMNNKGIGMLPGQADFDGSNFSYPADQLPPGGPITLQAQRYLFPRVALGAHDNVVALGQTISIPTGYYQRAYLLVAASWGMVMDQMIVHYTDGSTTTAFLNAPDWNIGPSGVVNTNYRYAPQDIGPGSVHIYAVSIGMDQTKIASSLTLPTSALPRPFQPSLHVFALTLQS